MPNCIPQICHSSNIKNITKKLFSMRQTLEIRMVKKSEGRIHTGRGNGENTWPDMYKHERLASGHALLHSPLDCILAISSLPHRHCYHSSISIVDFLYFATPFHIIQRKSATPYPLC